jgi:hypothetical protein
MRLLLFLIFGVWHDSKKKTRQERIRFEITRR